MFNFYYIESCAVGKYSTCSIGCKANLGNNILRREETHGDR